MIDQLAQLIPQAGQFFGAASCQSVSFLGLKAWYAYLPLTSECAIDASKFDPAKDPSQLPQLWLVGAAIFEDLVRLSALIAIGFIIAGGYQMMISQGEPQSFASGRKTVINALIGLAIAVVASQLIAFLAGKFA